MIQKERIKKLNDHPYREGDYVLYWMQASPRSHFNHALEYAINQANRLKKPLLAYFGITDNFPEANERHYHFLLEGLRETQILLGDRGIKLIIRLCSPPDGVIELAENASMVITDRGYLRIQREWVQKVISNIHCPFHQVETNVVVPVETASPKDEYSAATLRKKINKRLDDFLVPLQKRVIEKKSLDIPVDSVSLDDLDIIIKTIGVDSKVKPANKFAGGNSSALIFLNDFLKNKLHKFGERNDPSQDYTSHMSPYLHFGQISPLYIALEVLNTNSVGTSPYLDELIVRRELAMNLVFYNENYDNLDCLPEWAQKTLNKHRKDNREYTYSFEEFENAKTHDPYWNAAQKEMMFTGKMHGYMRMYWGKKIIEWTSDPEEAYTIALTLNNKYELDGRDPNGYAGVSWCFGKHDRAWKERDIFGKIRYMNANGLRRKFKIDNYVNAVEEIII